MDAFSEQIVIAFAKLVIQFKYFTIYFSCVFSGIAVFAITSCFFASSSLQFSVHKVFTAVLACLVCPFLFFFAPLILESYGITIEMSFLIFLNMFLGGLFGVPIGVFSYVFVWKNVEKLSIFLDKKWQLLQEKRQQKEQKKVEKSPVESSWSQEEYEAGLYGDDDDYDDFYVEESEEDHNYFYEDIDGYDDELDTDYHYIKTVTFHNREPVKVSYELRPEYRKDLSNRQQSAAFSQAPATPKTNPFKVEFDFDHE